MPGLFHAVAVASALALAACAAGEQRSDAARLQGNWRVVSAERNGAPAPDLHGHLLTFDAGRFRIASAAGRPLFGGPYTIDPAASPARINFQQMEGDTLRGTWLGLYRFVDRHLEIVDNAPDTTRPRPADFAGGPGYVLLRFVRP